MRLFDDLNRSDSSPAAYTEDSYGFLNRVAGDVWQRIRETLEEWFAAYPREHAADLRGRFRSRRPGAHEGAWWELYLYRLFLRMGYSVAVHPEVEGTSRRPDFGLFRSTERLYVEAAVVFSGVVDEGRSGTREAWIVDAVSRGKSRNFFVGLDFEQVGTQLPRDRDVVKPIEAWLETLDPDVVEADYESTGELPERLMCVGDWRLRFHAYPIKPEARDDPRPGRLLGVGPVTAGFVDDKEQLRQTLKHKAGSYGDMSAPLVVAVNCASSFMKDEDIANALYGSIAYQYTPGSPGSGKAVRLRDGVWVGEAGPRRHRMSAVLSGAQVHPGTAIKATPRLWLNPSPDVPLTTEWPFPTWQCSAAGLVAGEQREVDMAALLGLPADWPGPDSRSEG